MNEKILIIDDEKEITELIEGKRQIKQCIEK